jgi:hypothetical protein
MTEPNELPPDDGESKSDPPLDSTVPAAAPGADAPAGGPARLKPALEIQRAADTITTMALGGIIKEGRAKVAFQGLRLQLDCARAERTESGASSVGDADLDRIARLLDANPELLRSLSSTMTPEVFRALLRKMA